MARQSNIVSRLLTVFLYGLLWIAPLHYSVKEYNNSKAHAHNNAVEDCVICQLGILYITPAMAPPLQSAIYIHAPAEKLPANPRLTEIVIETPQRGPPGTMA
ncbi:MAG: hypothetical protein KIT80_00330 [Chitinophagaceae bacterium]|nr:hypothetical protein [Chitinophagaceae bacterium]MCW5925337.1 hypothetical protein [Chitinophagaceae bacterium]